MGEYIPAEQELVTELCNARECDWKRLAEELGFQEKSDSIATSGYRKYLRMHKESFGKIPQEYMLPFADWRDMPLSAILDEFCSAPKEYRRITSDDIPEDDSRCVTFCDEFLFESKLVKKVIALQELERRLSEAEADKADDEQGQQQKEPKLIKWRGDKQKLEQLAGELKSEGFIDDTGIFADQFECAGIQAAKERCQWWGDFVLLVYLFDRLKQEKFIDKKSNPDRLLTERFTDHETGKPVENIRQLRKSYRNNDKTLNGEPNIKNNGVPFNAEKIERILVSIQ